MVDIAINVTLIVLCQLICLINVIISVHKYMEALSNISIVHNKRVFVIFENFPLDNTE